MPPLSEHAPGIGMHRHRARNLRRKIGEGIIEKRAKKILSDSSGIFSAFVNWFSFIREAF